ncbi:hypothetical protein KA107_00295 [Candidatus Pacearchaeota archaeon]|nr:hypothetical protein [Candidatus Pacearchaeota archaeon]
MRSIYRAILPLGKKNENLPSFDAIEGEIGRWIQKTTAGQITADQVTQEGPVANGSSSLEKVLVERKDVKLKAFKLEKEDGREGFFWKTELVIRAIPNKFPLVTVDLSNGRKDFRMVPTGFDVSRPAIVPTLLDAFGSPEGMFAKSIGVTDEYVPHLIDSIRSPKRRVPFVYVSRSNETNRSLVDADSLANNLAGVAKVFEATNWCQGYIFGDQIGKSLSCFNGSVRIFWPSGQEGEDRIFHPYFHSEEIRKMGERRAVGRIFELIAPFTTETPIKESYAYVKHLKDREEAEKGRKSWEDIALDTDTRVKQLELELATARQRAGNLQRRLDSETEISSSPQEGQGLFLPHFRNPLEAYQHAMTRIPGDRLVCASRVNTQIEGNKYKNPVQVYNALVWLAFNYLDARRGVTPDSDLEGSSLKLTGLEYKPNQKETTMKMYKEEYYVVVDGVEFALSPHLSKGTSPDSELSLRVGFDYDKKNKRIIVGYIGPHQTNRAS